MRIFDTHCHLGLLYEDPVSQIRAIDEAKRGLALDKDKTKHANVIALANISTNLYDFASCYKNTKNIPNVFHTIGLSPSEVMNPGRDWEEKLDEWLSYENVIGVGEIGLDYHHKYGNKNDQIEFFLKQLDMAEKHELPVVLHNREAGEDMLDILKSKTPSKGGILHCFSENSDYAYKMIDLGIYISFAGNLTFHNATNLHTVAKNIPLENILIETDSPFLTPNSYRGQRNRPVFIVETLKFLAKLRNMPVEKLADILFNNSLKAYHLRLSDLVYYDTTEIDDEE